MKVDRKCPRATYNAEQCWSIHSYLESAAIKFDELAASLREFPAISKQFEQQAIEARKFSQDFAQANLANLEG